VTPPNDGRNLAPETPSGAAEGPGGNSRPEKRVWYIECKSNGRFTLKGGYPPSMMTKDPALRQKDIGGDFPTKEALLQHLDQLQFCLEGDTIIMDGDRVAMD
jgi:hypothetical protein